MSDTPTADPRALRTLLRKRHRAHQAAEQKAAAARDAFYVAAAAANDAGVTLEEIGADLGGLSKQRVSDVVRAVRART